MKIQQINNQAQNKQSFGMNFDIGRNINIAKGDRYIKDLGVNKLEQAKELMKHLDPLDKSVKFDIFTPKGQQPTLLFEHDFVIGGKTRTDSVSTTIPAELISACEKNDDFKLINEIIKRDDFFNHLMVLKNKLENQVKYWQNVAKELNETYKDL